MGKAKGKGKAGGKAKARGGWHPPPPSPHETGSRADRQVMLGHQMTQCLGEMTLGRRMMTGRRLMPGCQMRCKT